MHGSAVATARGAVIFVGPSGVGKSTLAAALQQKGKSILLIDADPQVSMSEALGITEETEKNLFTELLKEIKGESREKVYPVLEIRDEGNQENSQANKGRQV